ncbi:MAG TPA: ankyrin repeat domain-containing protein [Devosiaceae bacterium]|jgi:hypothetical protein|nr:ankyrin repeat domain-containing protein [Devosiaceae bacterium]
MKSNTGQGKSAKGTARPRLIGVRYAVAAATFALLTQVSHAATVEEMQLLNAASSCSIEEMIVLLDQGVSVEARSTGGHTPLIMAAFGDCPEAVEVLLERGADEEARDTSGYTALDLALLYDYFEVAELLGGEIEEDLPHEDLAEEDEWIEVPPDGGANRPAAPSVSPAQQSPIPAGPAMCKDMYLSCQATCGYFVGTQWQVDYSCTAQCAACNEACENGRPVACTNGFRPWGGQ